MVLETRLYDILCISPGASIDEISKSYKKIALRCHPDKTNHDPQLTEKFKQVTRAYEVLKDNNSRTVYDKYGESGLDGKVQPTCSTSQRPANNFQFRSATDVFSQVFSDFNNAFGEDTMSSFGAGPFGGSSSFGSSSSFGPFDAFNGGMNMGGFGNMNMPFNMGSGNMSSKNTQGMKKTVKPAAPSRKASSNNPNKVFKGKNIYHTCKVSLEDLCFGKTIKLQLPRRTRCGGCNGEGGFNKSLFKTCQGSGRVVTTLSNQFTKYQEVGLCQDCSGTGTLFSAICKQCDDGYIVANKIIALSILPGTKDGDQIVVKSAADEGRNLVPGDVIIKIKQERHPYLIRKSNDLYMEYDIDLKTALLGGSITIKDFLKRDNDLRVFINVHGDDTLNGKKHQSIQSGEIIGTINPGSPKIVKGSGAPINHHGKNGVFYQTEDSPRLLDASIYDRGDLFIKFNVQLPSITDFTNGMADLNVLEKILPSADNGESNTDMRDDREVLDTHLSNLPDYSSYTQDFRPSPTAQPSFSSDTNSSEGAEPDSKRHRFG